MIADEPAKGSRILLGARRGSGGQEGGWVVWGDGLGAEGDEVGGCLNCDLGGFRGLTVIVVDVGTARGKELKVICRFCVSEELFKQLEISGSVGGFFLLRVGFVEDK